MGNINNIYTLFRNNILNSLGVERDLQQLILDKDISRAMQLFENNDRLVEEAMKEYDPDTHEIMSRPNKPRKGREPYVTEKLPRALQRYINEIAVFFLYGNNIKWSNISNDETTDDVFTAYMEFLSNTRFNTTQRQAKRTAGAETESAKLYHIYQDNEGKAAVKVVILSRKNGYTLRPLFDQYGNMLAFGYGYFMKENGKTVEHFDIQTPEYIYRCKKVSIGWDVVVVNNPSGKINIIYNKQPKEWAGVERRIDRIEMVDSKAADTNNYFADPKVKLSADIVNSLADPSTVGQVVECVGKDSVFEYVSPPEYSTMKEEEKKDLRESVLFDSFTPDFTYEAMKGTGTLSGDAMQRALVMGYIKRDINMEVYDINVDREKNLILAIMMNVTHIPMREQLSKLKLKYEFSEPFNEDKAKQWESVGKAYSDGIISLNKAVELLGITDDPATEMENILKNKVNDSKKTENNSQNEDFIVV